MSIKFLMKKAGWSPGAIATTAGLSGLGLGLAYNAYKKYKGEEPQHGLLKSLLLGAALATPALAHGFIRGNLDRDEYGDHTEDFRGRWFTPDDVFEQNPYVAYNLAAKDYAEARKRYRERDPITKEPLILKKDSSLHKKAWTPLSNGSMNNFNKVNLISAATGRTPVQDVLFANGLLNNTRQNSSFVTPGKIVGNLVNAGIGYGTAYVAGKTLGAMAGLSPQAQNSLCRMGAWGGMLSGIHNSTLNNNTRFF